MNIYLDKIIFYNIKNIFKEGFKMNKKAISIIILLLPLAVGALAAFLTAPNQDIYSQFAKPASAPPAYLFPVVWTVLYVLMGISGYLIYNSDSPLRKNALTLFFIQLIFNFFWSIIFFELNDFMFAFVWLVFLWLLIILMTVNFSKINKTAAYLQIPYLLWVTFAGYLNLAVYILNG